MQQDEEFQVLKCLPDQLQALCEKHGCVPGSDRLEWLSAQLDLLGEVAEALRMVRDADNDCQADGLATMPPIPRAKIDRALAEYTRERITPEHTPERIFPAAPGSLPTRLSDMGSLQAGQNVKPAATNDAPDKATSIAAPKFDAWWEKG